MDAVGPQGQTPLLQLARTEPEPVNLDLIMTAFGELINANADVHAVTPSGISVIHTAAEVGNHQLCRLLVEHGANVNVQSSEGFTAYGYARRKLARLNRMAAKSPGAIQQSHLLTKTVEVLLKLGAYKLEHSEMAIQRNSSEAQYMRSGDGSHLLRAATPEKLIQHVVRPGADPLDADALVWSFHQVTGLVVWKRGGSAYSWRRKSCRGGGARCSKCKVCGPATHPPHSPRPPRTPPTTHPTHHTRLTMHFVRCSA